MEPAILYQLGSLFIGILLTYLGFKTIYSEKYVARINFREETKDPDKEYESLSSSWKFYLRYGVGLQTLGGGVGFLALFVAMTYHCKYICS